MSITEFVCKGGFKCHQHGDVVKLDPNMPLHLTGSRTGFGGGIRCCDFNRPLGSLFITLQELGEPLLSLNSRRDGGHRVRLGRLPRIGQRSRWREKACDSRSPLGYFVSSFTLHGPSGMHIPFSSCPQPGSAHQLIMHTNLQRGPLSPRNSRKDSSL